MQTIVFLIYHGMGHFNACLRVAKILKQNHHVVFAGAEYFTAYVEGQGFMYYPLKTLPFGMGFEEWVNKQKKRKLLYLRTLKDRFTNALFTARKEELLVLMNDVNPDYILIDSYQSTDFIVLYPFLKESQIKIGFIQTILPAVIQPDCPPLNSMVFPDDRDGIKRAIKKLSRNKLKKIIRQKLLYLGMNDEQIILRGIQKSRIPLHYQSKETTLRGAPFRAITELVLAPKEFDFEKNNRSHFRHYIGFMPDPKRIEIIDREYLKTDLSIQHIVNETNAPLIYCSFGTVQPDDASAVTGFIKKLMQAVSNINYIVIISIHSIHHISTFSKPPGNVYLFKALPQLEILSRASVFITHGGLNSIKESIYACVPMLVYPPNEMSDSMGNATRVVYHKLGLRGDLRQDTSADIITKINELAYHKEYRKNLIALREIDTKYNERFIELFNTLQPVR